MNSDANTSVEVEMGDESVQDKPVSDLAREFLQEALRMSGFDVDITAKANARRLLLSVTGPDADALIRAPSGVVDLEVCNAYSLLLKRVAFPRGTEPLPVIIDVNGYRDKRAAQLEEVAADLAEKVNAGTNLDVLGMNSFDRRLVHRGLSAHENVSTESAGFGLFRRLMIRGERGESQG